MKLRTRLTLVLLLLSVVPLGAVTIYSYVNNVATLEEAASREADLLASELSARMQLITAELSNRVGHLMDMQTAVEVVPVVATRPLSPSTKSPATKPATAAAAPDQAPAMETQVATALGEAAMLLNSVELQGARSFRSRPPGSPGGQGSDRGGGGAPPQGGDRPMPPGGFPSRGDRGQGGGDRGRSGGSNQPGRQNPPGRLPASPLGPPPPLASTSGSASGTSTGTTPPPVTPAGGNVAVPPSTGGTTSTPAPAAAPMSPIAPPLPRPPSRGPTAPGTGTPAPVDPNAIVIDMNAIRREMIQKMTPEGSANMTPEERQRLSREIGARLMGITEGLKLGAAELQKKADAARVKAQEDAKKAEATHAADDSGGPTQTKSALKGNKLGVTVERNGQVVHAVNAEINLDQVLLTVFSTTRRDRGEVAFAVAKDGKIYTAVPGDKSVVDTFGSAIKPGTKAGKTILADWIVMTTDDPSGSGLRFGIARPVGDSLSDLRWRAERNAGLGLVLIALALVGVVPVSSRLTRNLSSLTDGVGSIARGDYTTRVPVKSNDEIGVLATAFNQMASDIQEHQRSLVSQERLKRELELGRQIQAEMLPSEPLRIGLMEVRGESVPAREVGGDFFNYFTLPSGEVALLLGDVSGKGVGAALVMANIQATLRTRLALEQDLSIITDALDRELEKSTRAAYATLIVGIYNPTSKGIRFVNAGHNPQFVLRANGGLDQMTSTGTPIGLLSGRGYQQGTLQLTSGDFIFFYTDGIVEAENELGEFFGSERLEAVLLESHKQNHGSIDLIFRNVKDAIKEFAGTREPFDDATMMAVRIG